MSALCYEVLCKEEPASKIIKIYMPLEVSIQVTWKIPNL